MNIEMILSEMDAKHEKKMAKMDADYRAEKEAHEARMAEMKKEHEAEMIKIHAQRKAAEAEAALIDAEIAAIDAEIAASKERTENKVKMLEAAQNRALQARTKEEIESAYAELRSIIKSL